MAPPGGHFMHQSKIVFLLPIVLTLLAFAEVSRHPLFVKWAHLSRPGLTWLLLAIYIPGWVYKDLESTLFVGTSKLLISNTFANAKITI